MDGESPSRPRQRRSVAAARVFPKELFTVEAVGADYPMMMSRSPAASGGRTIEAASGTHFAQSSSTYSSGNTQVTVTTTEQAASELSAATKFNAAVGRGDRWVEVQEATFSARDFSAYGSSSADRTLSMVGKAHK